ncbi:hypothetical protein HDV04_004884 [Boothiomyces sp. JEL0838]|nr:hypothetical protein HDV04_004884 [Boothiomyces sp. JEL0838]
MHHAAEVFAMETRKRREMEMLKTINTRRKENHIKKVERRASPIITSHYAPPAEQFLEIRKHDNRPQEWDTRREDLERVLKPSASFKVYSRTTTPVNRPVSVLEDIVSDVGLNKDLTEIEQAETIQNLHLIDVSPLNIQLPVRNVEDQLVEEQVDPSPYVTGDWTQSSRSASRASNKIAQVYKKKSGRAVTIRSARPVREKPRDVVNLIVEPVEAPPKQNYFADSNGKSCVIKTEPSGGIMDRSSRAASAYKSNKLEYLSTSMPEYHALEVYEVKKPTNFSKLQSSKSLHRINSQSLQKMNEEFGSKRFIKSAPLYRSMTASNSLRFSGGPSTSSISADTPECKPTVSTLAKPTSRESKKDSLTKKESKCRFKPISEAAINHTQFVDEESITNSPRPLTAFAEDKKFRNIVLENLSLPKARPYSSVRHVRPPQENILDMDALKVARMHSKSQKKFAPDLKDYKEVELHNEIEKLDSMLSKLGR